MIKSKGYTTAVDVVARLFAQRAWFNVRFAPVLFFIVYIYIYVCVRVYVVYVLCCSCICAVDVYVQFFVYA